MGYFDEALTTETFEHGEDVYRVQTFPQEGWDTESPRGWSNVSRLLTWGRDYGSPDEPDRDTPREVEDALDRCRVGGPYDWRTPGVRVGLLARWARTFAADDVLAVAALGRQYDGTLTVDFEPDPDDVYEGVAVIGREHWTECMADTVPTPELVREVIRGEVQTYNWWAEGNVYRFAVEVARGAAGYDEDALEAASWDHLDSCGGFLGDDDADALSEGRALVEWYRSNTPAQTALPV